LKGHRAIWVLPALAFLVSLVPFLPALDGQFLNWDDDENFLRNPSFRGLGWTHIRWMLTTTLMGHWIPVTWLSFGVNYSLGGMDPRGYHLGNLLLHALNAALLLIVGRRLLRAARGGSLPRWAVEAGALFAALLFGLHPLRVESVAWITERRDVLSGCFYLLSTLAYLRAVDGPILRPGWYGASLGAFALGLLSKASGVPLPLAFLLLDVYPLRRLRLGWPRLLAEKAPFALLAAACAGAALWAVGQSTGVTSYGTLGPGARLAMIAHSILFYPLRWLWPAGLSPMYELPPEIHLLEPRFLVPLVAVPVLTATLWALRRVFPAGLAAWTYSALMILPVSGVVHAGYQLGHDRYSYLSGLGLAMLAGGMLAVAVATGAQKGWRFWVLSVAPAGAVLVLVILSAVSWRQAQVWRSSEALWTQAIRVDPRCGVCQNNLGVAILQTGARDPASLGRAEEHFRAALAVRQDRPEWHDNLGSLLGRLKRFGEAEAEFQAVTRLAPRSALGHTGLGGLYLEAVRYPEAVVRLREAVRLEPTSSRARSLLAVALNNQAVLLARDGRLDDAASLLGEVASLQPDNVDALINLGQVLIAQGRPAQAVAPLERALALRSDSSPALFWLARAHLSAGDQGRAQAALERLGRLDPGAAARARGLR
jgi:protein O-mannosyl-transferase